MAETASKTIDGVTDLVVVAPIKPGFVEAFENITYESRLKLVAEALHKIRVNAREHEVIAPFADTAERILSLFNFRIGVLDPGQWSKCGSAGQGKNPAAPPQRYMFLVATFDGPWEPYMRLIWKPLGPFLDLLLCNCDGYKLATQTGFPEYADWVRQHQVEPSIFYSTTKLSVRDHIYLSQLEKMQRELDPAKASPPVDQQLAALTMTDPEAKARAVWADLDNARDALRLSFEALAVLYRLADYFPADRIDPTITNGEGGILLKAAQDLLLGLRARIADYIDTGDPALIGQLIAFGIVSDPQNPASQRIRPYFEAWSWFTQTVPSLNLVKPDGKLDRNEVQKGLLSDYDDNKWRVTNAMVLLLRITDAVKAAEFLRRLGPSWDSDAPQDFRVSEDLNFVNAYANTAFTANGLARMGLPSSDLARFPKEFRDGLFERAPQIGDVREHHPRRWLMPKRYLRGSANGDPRNPRIHPDEVDVVLQFRQVADALASFAEPAFIDYELASHSLTDALESAGLLDKISQHFEQLFNSIPLILTGNRDSVNESGYISEIVKAMNVAPPFSQLLFLLSEAGENVGIEVLTTESAFRPVRDDSNRANGSDKARNRDHFGFLDGISQPQPINSPVLPVPNKYDQRVPFGDVLVGYRNNRGDRPGDHHWDETREDYQTNGSFLVLRKIAQFPERLEAFSPEVAHAMVGRTRDGQPLVDDDPRMPNSFLYRRDAQQLQCPFSAHIRLANPRESFHGRPTPRIVRRGMSYGNRWIKGDAASTAEPRGMLFMAYNASIAEQYEVIQRWLNGGNATDVASAANDPLTGPAREPGSRTFRYRKRDGSVARAIIAEPLSEFRWGMYAFAPSKSALAKILALPAQPKPEEQGEVVAGRAIIQRVARLEPAEQRAEWKRLLEDFGSKDVSELDEMRRVWKAIRTEYGGVLPLPSGLPFGGGTSSTADRISADQPVVLVASKDAIEYVLSHPRHFSVCAQGERTERTFGAIYVAMDPGPRYARKSLATNEIVYDHSTCPSKLDEMFDASRRLATEQLGQAKKLATVVGQNFFKIELRRDFLVPVLADLCSWLFDIPDFDKRNFLKPYYFDRAPWGWQPIDPDGDTTAAAGMRKPRCPADFMAPSRACFYPRPTEAIQIYGESHGKGLYYASQNFVDARRAKGGEGFKGVLSSEMAAAIPHGKNELLARNIIGLMEGMLPPLDGIMRGIMFDWIETDTMWRHQSAYIAKAKAGSVTRTSVEAALKKAVETAICKRPAPDLIYRTATMDTTIGKKVIKAGTLVILGLGSPMMESLDTGNIDISPVFGGIREKAWQDPDKPTHACPAYGMVMAMIYGMVAALFDTGRIVVQPASLILRFDEWAGPGPGER